MGCGLRRVTPRIVPVQRDCRCVAGVWRDRLPARMGRRGATSLHAARFTELERHVEPSKVSRSFA
jgi:hypothetical protein